MMYQEWKLLISLPKMLKVLVIQGKESKCESMILRVIR